MNKNVTIVVLLLLAGIGAWYFSSTQKSSTYQTPESTPITTPEPTQTKELTSPQEKTTTPQSENTVVYSSSGFSPLTLTISPGSTVTFLNSSNTDMWIASDPHPIHNNFPQFDARKGSLPGQSYSFTFNKPGTYEFHNHLNPSSIGTIQVE